MAAMNVVTNAVIPEMDPTLTDQATSPVMAQPAGEWEAVALGATTMPSTVMATTRNAVPLTSPIYRTTTWSNRCTGKAVHKVLPLPIRITRRELLAIFLWPIRQASDRSNE
jgi:hypothetical protein